MLSSNLDTPASDVASGEPLSAGVSSLEDGTGDQVSRSEPYIGQEHNFETRTAGQQRTQPVSSDSVSHVSASSAPFSRAASSRASGESRPAQPGRAASEVQGFFQARAHAHADNLFQRRSAYRAASKAFGLYGCVNWYGVRPIWLRQRSVYMTASKARRSAYMAASTAFGLYGCANKFLCYRVRNTKLPRSGLAVF